MTVGSCWLGSVFGSVVDSFVEGSVFVSPVVAGEHPTIVWLAKSKRNSGKKSILAGDNVRISMSSYLLGNELCLRSLGTCAFVLGCFRFFCIFLLRE